MLWAFNLQTTGCARQPLLLFKRDTVQSLDFYFQRFLLLLVDNKGFAGKKVFRAYLDWTH